jgi:hypothetical protein
MSHIAVGTDNLNFEHTVVSTDTEVKIVLRDKKRSAVFWFNAANKPVVACFVYADPAPPVNYAIRLRCIDSGELLQETSVDGFKTVLDTYNCSIIDLELATPKRAFEEFMCRWHSFRYYDNGDCEPEEPLAGKFLDFQFDIKQDLQTLFLDKEEEEVLIQSL